jgi:YVTN family beta-propeller protein
VERGILHRGGASGHAPAFRFRRISLILYISNFRKEATVNRSLKAWINGIVLLLATLGVSHCAHAEWCTPDVNGLGDGKINVQDATIALRIVAGTLIPTPTQTECSDVYPYPGEGDRLMGDGKVNISDAVRLLRIAVGLDAFFPPVENTQLFTLNGGAGFSSPGSASLIDLTKLRIGDAANAVTVRAFGTGSVPNDFDLVGNKGYLVNSTGNTLQIVDLTTMKDDGVPIFLGTDANPAPNPMQSVIVGDKAYVSMLYANEVAVVDLNARSVVKRIPVGGAPTGMAAWNNQVFVTNTGFTWNAEKNVGEYAPGTVSVIDAATDAVIGTLNVPLNPTVARVDKQNRLHVVGTGNYADKPGEIAVFQLKDGASPELVGTVAAGGAPGAVVFSPTGFAYVANSLGGIMKYDPKSLQLIRGADNPVTLPGITEGPVDMAVDTRGRIYMALFGRDHVEVLDSRTDSVVGDVAVGDGPEALAIR